MPLNTNINHTQKLLVCELSKKTNQGRAFQLSFLAGNKLKKQTGTLQYSHQTFTHVCGHIKRFPAEALYKS